MKHLLKTLLLSLLILQPNVLMAVLSEELLVTAKEYQGHYGKTINTPFT